MRNVQNLNEDDHDAHDLHVVRGLVPAILLGAALWAAALVVIYLLW